MKIKFNMNMKTKIILSVVFVGVISVISGSTIVGWASATFGKKTLEESVKEQLISIREIKKGQIEDWAKV